jgi:hypothetical protein
VEARSSTPPEPVHDVLVERGATIPMHGGIQLGTDSTRPTHISEVSRGKSLALLERTNIASDERLQNTVSFMGVMVMS